MINLYWPVYINLEKEVLALSLAIHFDDEQLAIYSVKICDLLIRCSIEIESISKKLFIREGGKEPDDEILYFDTDCLEFLEKKWLLSQKKIILSSPNFHFSDEKNRVLTPLLKANQRGSSGAKWKKAYQAVKHERVDNLRHGNIQNVLGALAALFILNLYFKKESYDLVKDSKATGFSVNGGSEIFSFKLHKWSGYDGEGIYQKKDDFNECIYLTKWKQQSEEAVREANEEMRKENMNYLLQHPSLVEWLKNNKLEDYQGDNLAWDVLGKDVYSKMLAQGSKKTSKAYQAIEYESVLNENNI